MANLLQAKVKIVGVRPLLQHQFTEAALPLEKQERTGVAGNDPEEWRRTAMITKTGQLYLEPSYVFATLREGAKNTKKGKGSIQSAVASTLQITNDKILLDRYFPGFPNGQDFDLKTVSAPTRDADAPVYLDVRGVRNPSTKARNVRYRIAAAAGWRCEFNLLWDKTVVSRNEMEAVCRDAGFLVGLANGRAIGFGRFSLETFEAADA